MEEGSNHILMKTRKQTQNYPELPQRLPLNSWDLTKSAWTLPQRGGQGIQDAPLTLEKDMDAPPAWKGGVHGQTRPGLSEKGQICRHFPLLDAQGM
jgi:hypothetical protein